jgi:hypothetical protein
MKTLAPIENKPIIPRLFQIASRFEEIVSVALMKPLALNKICFTDLILHPEKVEAMLKTANIEEHTTTSNGRAAQKAPSTKHKTNGADKSNGHGPCEFKKTEFFLDAPGAKSVKLAADFTDWEKRPVNLVKLKGEVWHTVVPLPPGQHSYRFIVDGQWCDDPLSVLRIPNPFGTVNAVTIVK